MYNATLFALALVALAGLALALTGALDAAQLAWHMRHPRMGGDIAPAPLAAWAHFDTAGLRCGDDIDGRFAGCGRPAEVAALLGNELVGACRRHRRALATVANA